MKGGYPMPIPQHLKEQKIWTLSSSDKIPIDLFDVYQSGLYIPLRLNTVGQLYDYDTVKSVHNNHPDTYMTLYVNQDLNITLVDIETEGVREDNPFMYLDFDYFEVSKSGGRHGILPYTVNEIPEITKDKATETELFSNNHFMIITEDEAPLPQIKYHLTDLSDRFNEASNEDIDIDGTRFEDVYLTGFQKLQLESLNIKPYKYLDPDTSANEFKYVRYITRQVLTLYHDEDTVISGVVYLTNQFMPYRNKHTKYANFRKYGYISKRLQTILDAVYSILETQY